VLSQKDRKNTQGKGAGTLDTLGEKRRKGQGRGGKKGQIETEIVGQGTGGKPSGRGWGGEGEKVERGGFWTSHKNGGLRGKKGSQKR